MPALRTRVYIDGYNLYYGCHRKTAFKWLDVLCLFETQILPTILYRPTPDADLYIRTARSSISRPRSSKVR
ncbi:hypothetical protein ABID08_006863 [Rhizobium binae]|uniref:NYN domain-containing protein n=1 Tax=Rhizobium binae TaxID=1138190 RepID=A0ABV2MSM5_9HYPH|nr:NYN domain-containing protein [Rhizobium binae]MBX4994849.1 hypothetical protein [Rhizobium binae]NKL52912.1 hypothetical protein [Rhizobium leguminosarum bv. viciae]QSY85372.1 hypothetical protein J2J99_25450 [Rhizobium binae]